LKYRSGDKAEIAVFGSRVEAREERRLRERQRIEDKKEAGLCRKYLDMERDGNEGGGMGYVWGVQRKQ